MLTNFETLNKMNLTIIKMKYTPLNPKRLSEIYKRKDAIQFIFGVILLITICTIGVWYLKSHI